MKDQSQLLRQKITAAFIKELEAFKRGGYQFNGSGRQLFEGTQREAFDAYLDGIKHGHTEGYYEIPTGVGKTALFIAIISCYLRATENMPDAPRIIIHEPTNDLVVQTALAFADFMPEIAREIETDDDQGREIDWENSRIGVKHKGAKRKSHIVITTYQGQAADERKEDGKEKTYKPEEYGLIIHDEAHYLTGAKYGPVAVNKFRSAIQLGVTATPEYSEDKTVANKLGYRYYHLPLTTIEEQGKIKKGAIERGDLCHVRPIVLKTYLKGKDKINLDRAKKFLEQSHGRPFNNKQLEQLLNQEARNQAIIKAYLTGEHPDTGEQFLGQTGMIFAGGIMHCNDFIRDANKVLDKPAYREVKNWLRDQGLSLIAPIHSKVPKDGTEIIIGGKKRICTKDEIKELHRQGKILLIISDQELKLGSDFPMDSFIADAVDRFSVPDATQRMGRGFRVDRGNERLGLMPNPAKSCAAINVIDETTHEMYKGTPHHPIHAIEILHGAEFRPPGRRKGALLRFKEHPPKVSEDLETLGFEFITRTEAVKDIAQEFKKGKKIKIEVPEGYKTGLELEQAIQKINPDSRMTGGGIIAKIRSQHQKGGGAAYKGVPVPPEAVAEYTDKGRPAYAIRQQEFDEIVKVSAAVKISKEYKTALDLGQELLKVRPVPNPTEDFARKRGHQIITDIRDQHKHSKLAIYEGVPIPLEAIVKYNSHGRSAYGIRQKEFDAIVVAYSKKSIGTPSGYRTTSELSKAIEQSCPGVSSGIGAAISGRVRKLLETEQSVVCKGVPFVADSFISYQSSQGQIAYAIRQKEFDALVASYAAKTKKTSKLPSAEKSFKTKPISKKTITPDSDDIRKRTDRSLES